MDGTLELTPKGRATRERILGCALALFREHGLDGATMRAVAAEAGMALGSAYHYFPGKDAIVLAYYERVQDEHGRRMAAELDEIADVGARVAAMLHAKLDIVKDDRRLLGALMRYTGEPDSPLSFLGRGTRSIRHRSMAICADAIGDADLPADLRVLVPVQLWALEMGVLLYFLYDDSPGQERTRRLVDGAAGLFTSLLKLARLPVLRPVRSRLVRLLDAAGLIPDAASIRRHRRSAAIPEQEEV